MPERFTFERILFIGDADNFLTAANFISRNLPDRKRIVAREGVTFFKNQKKYLSVFMNKHYFNTV